MLQGENIKKKEKLSKTTLFLNEQQGKVIDKEIGQKWSAQVTIDKVVI